MAVISPGCSDLSEGTARLRINVKANSNAKPYYIAYLHREFAQVQHAHCKNIVWHSKHFFAVTLETCLDAKHQCPLTKHYMSNLQTCLEFYKLLSKKVFIG